MSSYRLCKPGSVMARGFGARTTTGIAGGIAVTMLLLSGGMGCEGDYPSEGRRAVRSSFFERDVPGGETDLIALEMVGAEENVLTLALTAKTLTQPVYGIATEVLFESEDFAYVDYQPAEFFGGQGASQGPQRCRSALLDGEPGRLVVGASRLGDLPGLTGSGEVLHLRFKGLRNVEGSRFELSGLVCRGADLSPIPGVTAVGGSATSRVGR